MIKLVVSAAFGLAFASFLTVAAAAATTVTENYSTDYVVISSKSIQLSPDHTITTSEFQGISHSDRPGGRFDNMAARCTGASENDAGAVTSHGACSEMYPDGSTTFTTYTAQSSPGGAYAGVHTFLGGTGKFAGITGKADYTVQFVKAPETATMFIVRHKAMFTLP